MDYTALGLDTWTLFACVRVALYGAYMTTIDYQANTVLCDLTRHTLLIKYCNDERASDWRNYCYALYTSGNKIDCENSNVAAVNEIQDKLAMSPSSKQSACLKRLRG